MPPTRPTRYVGWCPDANPTAVVEPPRSLTDMGWSPGEPMPAPYANWGAWLTDQWIQWLDQTNYATVQASTIDPAIRLINGGSWAYDQDTTFLSWSEAFNLSIPGALDSANQAAAGQVALASGQVAYVAANIPISVTGDLTSGSAIVSDINYTSGLAVGQTVRGSGIPNGTTVTALNLNGRSATLSAAATATANDTALVFQGSGALTVQTAAVDQLVLNATIIVLARAVSDRVFLGVNSGQMMLRHGERKRLSAGGFLTTHLATAGSTMSARTPVYLSAGTGDSMVLTGTLTSGSATVSVASSTGLNVGDSVSGTGIPGGATIATVPNATTFTLSANATASGAQSLTVTRQVGRVYPCDASSAYGLNRAVFLGVTNRDTTAGASVTVVTDGVVSGYTGLAPGRIYYVDPATAALTTTKPTIPGDYTVAVGLAIESTVLDINPSQGGGSSQNSQGGGWPNYVAATQAGLQSALSSAATTGGVVLVVSDLTLTTALTVPARTILLGRQGAAKLTLSGSGQLTLADSAEIRDLYITSPNTSGVMVAAPNGNNALRGCTFQAASSGSIVCLSVTGNNVRSYSCTFLGVVGYVNGPTGIAYLDGGDNSDDDCIFSS